MTRYEEELCISVVNNLSAIAKSLNFLNFELKKANELKALELKGSQYLTPEKVNAVLDHFKN